MLTNAYKYYRMLPNFLRLMRICAKLHSEGHSQGKFGICESRIRALYTYYSRGVLTGIHSNLSSCFVSIVASWTGTFNFVNITMGVTNPHIFDLPTMCKKHPIPPHPKVRFQPFQWGSRKPSGSLASDS